VTTVRADGRLRALDGYRGLAAVAVVLYHTTGLTGRDVDRTSIAGNVDAWLAPLGHFGVALFFVLSGFLLYRPFAAAHVAGADAPAWRSFWFRRILRIFPAYWLVLGVSMVLPLLAHRRPAGASGLLGHAALVHTFGPDGFSEGLVVAWTLCVEASFYAVLPLLALAITWLPGGRSGDEAIRLRCQWIGTSAIVVLAVWYRLLPGVHQPGGLAAQLWLPAHLAYFGCGMLLAVGRVRIERGWPTPPALRAVADRPWLPWIVALQLYWIGVQLHMPVTLGETAGTTQHVTRYVVNSAACLLLLAPAVLGQRDSATLRLLDRRPLVGLGVVSYGLYLWHMPVLLVLADLGVPRSPGPLLVATLVVSLTLSWGTHRLLERPLMRGSRRRRGAPVRATRLASV
jgi:peptidoglycan/LPS O-acetylase OafA/YrhL